MNNLFYSNNRSNSRRNACGHHKHPARPLRLSMNFTDNFSDFQVSSIVISVDSDILLIKLLVYYRCSLIYTIQRWINPVAFLITIDVYRATTIRLRCSRMELAIRRLVKSLHFHLSSRAPTASNRTASIHFNVIRLWMMTAFTCKYQTWIR